MISKSSSVSSERNDSEDTEVFSSISEDCLWTGTDERRIRGLSAEEDPPMLLSPLSVKLKNENRQRNARNLIFFPEVKNLRFLIANILTAFQNQ